MKNLFKTLIILSIIGLYSCSDNLEEITQEESVQIKSANYDGPTLKGDE